mmetsp:Transcript_2980/g.5696  ORF Transcript_2980/g.5696 Transcript_2980/m.5696 type:complete len:314 (-) Transcript_2980:1059-2000(-)
MVAFIAGTFGGLGGGQKSRPSCGYKRLPVQALAEKDSRGYVELATPFGIVSRDPMELPPMVAMAVESTASNVPASRISELMILVKSNVKRKLVALQELQFYPRESVTPTVVEMTKDTEELVRAQAAYVCAMFCKGLDSDQMVGSGPYLALLDTLQSDGSPTVRSASASALSHLSGEHIFNALIRTFLEDADWLVRMSAAVSLGSIGDKRAAPVLLQTLRAKAKDVESQSLVIQAIIGALAQLEADEALDDILSFWNSSDLLVRQQVAEGLARFGGGKVAQTLELMTKDPAEIVAQQAKYSLQAWNRKYGNTPN